jgi:phosphatidylglycerophosphatase A
VKPPLVTRALATWFGTGLSPIAPGTVGSLATIPLHIVLCQLPALAHWASVFAVTLGGVLVAERYAKDSGKHDPGEVVIDEVAGTLIAMGLLANHGWLAQVLAFAAFRVLDITKPGPIDRVQKLKPEGVGIMADDVLAGLGAGLLVLAFVQLFARLS